MSATARTLARCGSDVLVEDGERWIFGRQPGTGGGTLVFVLGLLAVIVTINGVVQTVLGSAGAGVGVGLVMLAVGLLFVWATVAIVRRRNRLRASAPVEPVLVLDFPTSTLRTGDDRELAPLAEVEFVARMQLASSASALHCRWPGGSRVVLRGNPFGGSIGPAEDALRSRRLRVG